MQNGPNFDNVEIAENRLVKAYFLALGNKIVVPLVRVWFVVEKR